MTRANAFPVTVLAAVLLAAGCGDDDVTTATAGGQPGEATASTTSTTAGPDDPIPGHPVVDEDGVLYRVTLPPGECQSCRYALALDLDGVATYTAPGEDHEPRTVTVGYDAAAFVDLLTGVSTEDLVAGRTDCGREVDGNAPVFALGPGPEVDTCYRELDSTHPVNRFVDDVRAEAVAAHDPGDGDPAN